MKYPTLTCAECGARVAENWYIRHVKSGCKVGARPPDREWEVIRRLASGCTETEIARQIGTKSIRGYLGRASQRLGVSGRTNVLLESLRRGEVRMDELIAPAHVLGKEWGG